MRFATVVLAGFLVMLPAGSAVKVRRPPEEAEAPAELRLPASLDALYPPAAARPAYLLQMLSLETAFLGIVADISEHDFTGARETFAEFRVQYRKTAEMVPEWKREYLEEKVEELEKALAAEDGARAMSAFESLGRVCHNCHRTAMVPVQQKYHWGDFGTLTVPDPSSAAGVPYPQFKQYLAANLAGITMDLKQGQTDNARTQFEQFRARFETLSDSCHVCHEGESRYFMDREIRDTVARIGAALRNQTAAASAVAAFMQKVGAESCAKCHRVHLPAAYARRSAQ